MLLYHSFLAGVKSMLLLQLRLFLAIMLCTSLYSYESDPSLTATKELGKFMIATCIVLPQIMLMGGNWGGLVGFSFYHQFGEQAVAHPNVILQKPFRIEGLAPNPQYCHACTIGALGGMAAAAFISIPYTVPALSPGRYIQTIEIIAALSIFHMVAYPLAKRTLQWHIDRSYYRGLTRGA